RPLVNSTMSTAAAGRWMLLGAPTATTEVAAAAVATTQIRTVAAIVHRDNRAERIRGPRVGTSYATGSVITARRRPGASSSWVSAGATELGSFALGSFALAWPGLASSAMLSRRRRPGRPDRTGPLDRRGPPRALIDPSGGLPGTGCGAGPPADLRLRASPLRSRVRCRLRSKPFR